MEHFKGLAALFPQYSNSIYNHIHAHYAALPYVYIKVSRKVRRNPGKPGTGRVAGANSCGAYHPLAGIGQCLGQMTPDKSGSARNQYGLHAI
jgi:hypothetical protein